MLNRMGAALVAEAVGTFLFFFVGAGAVVLAATGADGPGWWASRSPTAWRWPCSSRRSGAVSGGHFNPAVTVAVRLAGRHRVGGAAVIYIVAQLAGAVAAGLRR